MPIPVTHFDAWVLRSLQVDKYSCIRVDINYYSVLEICLSKTIKVKTYPEYLQIYNQKNELIARYERRHIRDQFYMQLDRYLRTLLIKPGALTGAESFQQADENLQKLFFTHFKTRSKEFH